ncbi:uncharacterized protein EI90DRAFT_3057818 [Cantharellus anzutake]|uniref:uncharacterized protein n=1 Tax=Cantharellus anzutake TaxID=1750568 RepID=UPI0019054BE2|nr:uncharacterized protein EI90DRAFT_3057818 [Cantharellus anzutake]KAF8331393.1 hypothetical protein EI90DRAFT_3057818 [Cantharellus anzutake]
MLLTNDNWGLGHHHLISITMLVTSRAISLIVTGLLFSFASVLARPTTSFDLKPASPPLLHDGHAPHFPSPSISSWDKRLLVSPGAAKRCVNDEDFPIPWAGAELESKNKTSYITATSTFTIPQLQSTSQNTTQHVATLVGLYCEGVALTRINFAVHPDNTVIITGGTTGDSDSPQNISFGIGDIARISIFAFNSTVSVASLENLSKQDRSDGLVIHNHKPLCNSLSAAWGVGAFNEGNSQSSYANFGTVTYHNAAAYSTVSGSIVGPDGAGTREICGARGTHVTSTSIASANVTISYLGP